jgi:hypothetical protein
MLDNDLAKRVKDALHTQKYNLLLGSGISLDSTDHTGRPLQSAEDLRKNLCHLTGARDSSPLWRVSSLLDKAQIKDHITTPYLGCKAGPTAKSITRFAWRSAYTLNIDDALENAYETNQSRIQTIIPINYSRDFETFRNPQELPLIHLHGTTRRPDEDYVFSLHEYAKNLRSINPWAHSLSGLIITEPFIISGTSIFEPDLEYFMAHRPSNSEVLYRAPSILVEPYPDAGTRKDCDRLNLILVESNLKDFLDWLEQKFGPPPSPHALLAPKHRPKTTREPSTRSSAAFWSDFEFIHSTETIPQPHKQPDAFTFGAPPTWDDIQGRHDVPLKYQLDIVDEIRRWQTSNDENQFMCISGLAGSGKSTTLRRTTLESSDHGIQCFYLKSTGGFDLDSAIEFFSSVEGPILLATDSIAEHGDQLLALTKNIATEKRICILGAERKYRLKIVSDIFENELLKFVEIPKWRIEETDELIRRYTKLGIIGSNEAIKTPRKFALDINTNTAAEAVCRILNDFRPMKTIARSLWNDTIKAGRTAYLMTSIAHYCMSSGIRSSIISSIFDDELVKELTWDDAPLRIIENPDDDSYLIPGSALLSSLLVQELKRSRPKFLMDIAVDLANSLSPFVTRITIQQRTTEARLAGRLFDADGVMADLLQEGMLNFYEGTYEKWKWNSRYWEQRALYVSKYDRDLAVRHARHAVSIERHPFPMTTLAQILFTSSADRDPPDASMFNEAFSLMEETLRIESRWERGKTSKAYSALLEGTWNHLKNKGRISLNQEKQLRKRINEAMELFSGNENMHLLVSSIDEMLIER